MGTYVPWYITINTMKKYLHNKAVIIPMLGLALASGVAGTALAAENGKAEQKRGAPFEKMELTDAQKAALKEAKTLHDAGKDDEAKAKLESAELKGMGPMGGIHGHAHSEKHQAMRAALEAEDYAAFLKAVAGSSFASSTKAQFDILVEVSELHESGKHKEARALMKTAGFPKSERAEKHE